MSWNETQVTVVGNIVSDVTHKHTADGVGLVNFRVGATERRFDRESRQWVDGDKLFFGVTCWRKLADGVATSLSKGDPVIVQGRLRTRNFESEGQRRSVVEIDAVAVGPDLNRCFAHPQRNRLAAEIVVPRTDADREAVDAPC
jgi:single-strand DNA-binding protein